MRATIYHKLTACRMFRSTNMLELTPRSWDYIPRTHLQQATDRPFLRNVLHVLEETETEDQYGEKVDALAVVLNSHCCGERDLVDRKIIVMPVEYDGRRRSG